MRIYIAHQSKWPLQALAFKFDMSIKYTSLKVPHRIWAFISLGFINRDAVADIIAKYRSDVLQKNIPAKGVFCCCCCVKNIPV